MTLLIAYRDGNATLLAADSASSTDEGSLVVRAPMSKLWKITSQFAIGFTGTFAIWHWIRYGYAWEHGDTSVEYLVHLAADLVKSINKRFKEESTQFKQDWCLLLVTPTYMYSLDPFGDIEESSDAFKTLGSAGPYAQGALHILKNVESLSSWDKIQLAMDAAMHCDCTIRKPLDVISVQLH